MTAYGKIHRSIWNDPDFRALTPHSKLLYIHLFSHPKLTKVGGLDLNRDRWGRAMGTTDDETDAAVAELEARRFVVVDRVTEELVVRTYVKNDGFAGNWKMLKAMWRAWDGVESEPLRFALIEGFPQEVWESRQAPPPPLAQIMKQQVDYQSIGNAIGNPIANRTGMPLAIPPATATATVPVPATRQSAADEPTTSAQLASVHALRDQLGGTSA